MKPDIVDMPAGTSSPVYDLIIGVETMASLGCILDFQNNEITLDGTTLPMRPLRSFMDQKRLNSIFQKFEEPSVTKALNGRTVKILDVKTRKLTYPE